MSRIVCLCIAVLLVASLAAQTPTLRRGVSVEMPVTVNAVAVPDADLEGSLLVAVTRDGSAFLSIDRATPAQLSERVGAQLASDRDKRVYVKADARTPYSSVAGVLDALRTAGVRAAILLTSQPGETNARYVPPVGLEVTLPPTPNAAREVALPSSVPELRQRARSDQPVVLLADDTTPFGEIVEAIDMYRGVGAEVFLATPPN